jgi:GxxExxY protein
MNFKRPCNDLILTQQIDAVPAGKFLIYHGEHRGHREQPIREGEVAINDVSGSVVDGAMRVHTQLGPGLLESAYQVCLVYELRKRGLDVQTQVELPVVYDEIKIDVGYRADMLVEGALLVEIKAVNKLLPIHEAQLLSYLKLGGFWAGLLINFHVPRLKDGIRRMVN